jgi:hypothetical protein
MICCGLAGLAAGGSEVTGAPDVVLAAGARWTRVLEYDSLMLKPAISPGSVFKLAAAALPFPPTSKPFVVLPLLTPGCVPAAVLLAPGLVTTGVPAPHGAYPKP